MASSRSGGSGGSEGEVDRSDRNSLAPQEKAEWRALHAQAQHAANDPKTQYKLSMALGEGAHCSVFKAQHRIKKHWVALKRVHTSTVDKKRPDTYALLAHAAQLRALRHPNLRRYFGAKLRDEDVWLVTAFFERGNLPHSLLLAGEKRFNELQIKSVVWQLLHVLSYLRDAHYSEPLVLRARRLYPERDGTLCLDAMHVPRRHYAAAEAVHKVEWLAPEEVAEGRRDLGSLVFLLGVLVLELANGHVPPLPSNAARAARAIALDPSPTLDEPELWTRAMADLVSRCLQKDPSKRPAVHELLVDPWLSDASKAPLAALYAQRPGFDDNDAATATTAPSLGDPTPDLSTPRSPDLDDTEATSTSSPNAATRSSRSSSSSVTVASPSSTSRASPSSSPTSSSSSSSNEPWSLSDVAALAAAGVVAGALLVFGYALLRARHSDA